MALITLLTDFGLSDEYVGVLKGVISGINPGAVMIDVTHGISPQNVLSAAYTLKAAYPYFPPGSIHMASAQRGTSWPCVAMDICFWRRIMACYGPF